MFQPLPSHLWLAVSRRRIRATFEASNLPEARLFGTQSAPPRGEDMLPTLIGMRHVGLGLGLCSFAPSSGEGTVVRRRKALWEGQLVFAVEGVVGARIWVWPGGVAVGVSVGAGVLQDETLRHVEAAIAPLRAHDEVWDFGILDAA